jgi:hypothetical protein
MSRSTATEKAGCQRGTPGPGSAPGGEQPATENGGVTEFFSADPRTERLSAQAVLAEGVGFEPTRGSAPTRSPGVRLEPLGHPSERARPYSGRNPEATVIAPGHLWRRGSWNEAGLRGTEPWPGEVPDPGFPSTSASSPVRELAIRAPDLSSESTAPGRPTIDAVAGLSVTKPWAEDAGPSRPSALRRPARPAFSLPAPGSVSSAPGRPWAGTGAARRSCSSPRCAPPRFARTA